MIMALSYRLEQMFMMCLVDSCESDIAVAGKTPNSKEGILTEAFFIK